MKIIFGEISENSISIVIKNASIHHWDSTHFDGVYEIDINEYNEEKKIIKITRLNNLFWEDWTLSAELFRAWHDKKSQELNMNIGSYDNNFGLLILADQTVPKLVFEIGTGANCYHPIPYGTAYFQDVYWEDILRISRELLVMELKGLKKEYQKKLKRNKETEEFDVVNRIKIIEKKIELYSGMEDKEFSHPGDIIEIIIKEASNLGEG